MYPPRVITFPYMQTKMMNLADEYGRKIFKSISITLVCGAPTPRPAPAARRSLTWPPRVVWTDDCLKTEHPELCRHKMSSMPRWLSSSKVEIVRCDQSRRTQNHHLLPFTLPLMRRRNLLAEDPAMMCAWDRTVLPSEARLKTNRPNSQSPRDPRNLRRRLKQGLPRRRHPSFHDSQAGGDTLQPPGPVDLDQPHLRGRRPVRGRAVRLFYRVGRVPSRRSVSGTLSSSGSAAPTSLGSHMRHMTATITTSASLAWP